MALVIEALPNAFPHSPMLMLEVTIIDTHP